MRQFRTMTFGFAAAALAALSAPAVAGTVDMTFEGLTDNVFVTTHYTGSRGAQFTQSTYAGRFEWSVTSSSISGFNSGDTVYTFCTELTEYASSGTFTETPITDLPNSPGSALSPMGSVRSGLLSELYTNHFFEAAGLHGHAYDKDKAAAFQIAAWEIVYQDADGEGDLSLNVSDDENAGFKVSNIHIDIRSQANTWLAGLTGDATGVSSTLIGLGGDGLQDQITMVPLPATIALAAFGLGGIALGRRRLTRRLAHKS